MDSVTKMPVYAIIEEISERLKKSFLLEPAMPSRKKQRPAPPSEKIPSGLNSRDFLKYYESHRGAFQLEDTPSGRRHSREDSPSKGETPDRQAVPSSKGKKQHNVGSQPGDRGKRVGLRIIGGKLKALKLEYGGDHRVRPMKDRIRESVFNLMGTYAAGRHVIDLFSGTGALAFEALSRGAFSATLLEIHFPSARVIRRNIALVEEKAPEFIGKIDLNVTDVFFWGKELAELESVKEKGESVSAAHFRTPLPNDRPWLVFCSPPYDFFVSRQTELLELLGTLQKAAPPESVFVVESDARFDFGLLGVEIPKKKRRSYPPAEIGIFMTHRESEL